MGNIERWERLNRIGGGGQGVVYLVRDRELFDINHIRSVIEETLKSITRTIPGPLEEMERDYSRFLEMISAYTEKDNPAFLAALKELNIPAEARDPELAEKRIQLEIEGIESISHPNVIRIIDSNSDESWFVSKYYRNGVLSEHLDKYRGEVLAALRAFRGLVDGVSAIHDNNMVHRDIKPDNVFIDEKDKLVLGDLGLLFFTDEGRTRISKTFDHVGSRFWMPPWSEGKRIEDIDQTFDVYSLGKLLWSMISGKPFLNREYFRTEENDLNKLFPNKPYMNYVNHLLAKCLVEDSDSCIPNANELLEEVDRLISSIEMGVSLLSPKLDWPCKVCGKGKYVIRVDDDIHGVKKFGLNPTSGMEMKIYVCDFCGNIQYFLPDSKGRKDFWKGTLI